LADILTRDALFRVGRRYIVTTPNTRINPKVVDVEGSDVNLVVGQTALMGEALSAGWANCMRAMFVDSARGSELDRIAFDRFGITRKPAAAATVDWHLQRPNVGAGGGTVDAGTRIAAQGGQVFALKTDVVFGSSDLSLEATGVAQLVGPEQNVPAGTLWSFQDAPFDPTIVVSNTTPAAGGANQETDPAFRGRIRSYFLTLRRATLGAIQYAATTVPGVAVSTAYEIVNPGDALPAGAVELIVGDEDGNATSLVLQAVRDVLLDFRACGIPVFLSGGKVAFEDVRYRLAFSTGIDTVRAASEVRSTIVAMTQFLRPGQTLLRSDVFAAARAVPGVIAREDSVQEPAGDVVPPDNQTIIRVRAEDVSFE